MAEVLSTLDTVGVGGLFLGLAQCHYADRDLAINDASRVVPKTVLQQSAKHWRLAVQSCIISLVQSRDVHHILMLGNDLSLLEALQAIGYNGKTELLLSRRVAPIDCVKVGKNVPAGLDVEVLTPGLVPVLEAGTTVVAIGYDAGSGYVMVEAAASRALGSLRGQRFAGDVIAMLPLSALTVHERPANWQMVHHHDQFFTDYCRPGGLEPVPNNV